LHGVTRATGPIQVVITQGKKADRIVYTSRSNEPEDPSGGGSESSLTPHQIQMLLTHFLSPDEKAVLVELSSGLKKGVAIDNHLSMDKNHRIEVCKNLKARGMIDSSGDGYKLAGDWVLEIIQMISSDG
jgi:hypothetical protein